MEPGDLAMEARLRAQRNLLCWLLVEIVERRDQYERVIDQLEEPYPPLDFQEDPGAVPVEAFGAMAAFCDEIQALLAPLKEKWDACGPPSDASSWPGRTEEPAPRRGVED